MGTSGGHNIPRQLKPKTEFFLSLILLTALAAVAVQITFSTGAPELKKSGRDVVPKTENEYATFSEPMKNDPSFVVIKKKPANLGPGALYGWNFVVEGTNRGWILEGDEERGWQIYLDRKAEGRNTGHVGGRWRGGVPG
jgi:hypothetical protein